MKTIKTKPLSKKQPLNLLGKNTPLYDPNLIARLISMLNDQHLTTDLYKAQVSNQAEAFLLIFVCLCEHPELISHPNWEKMQKTFFQLFHSCFTNSRNYEQLYDILNRRDKPANKAVKVQLNDFVRFVVENFEFKNVEKSQRKRGIKG